MNNMKIMIIQPSIYMYGGAERQIVKLANHLTWNNHMVTIFTTGAVKDFKRDLHDARVYETGTFDKLVKRRGRSQIFQFLSIEIYSMLVYSSMPP